MKTLIPIIIGLLCITSLLAAFSGFYGYVYDEGEVVPYAHVRVWRVDFDTLLQCNGDGYYYVSCAGNRYYNMRAFANGKEDVKYVECTGKIGGDQVDFELDWPKP